MRKLTNRALFICFALMTSFCLIAPATALRSYAQEGGGSTLEGLIKDDSGPLLGATVIVKNTTRGTTTDMDGKFRLEGLQPGDVLQVTYVGYDPYEVTYTGQTTLDILMTTTANQLNAVVVTAMGIERQSKTLSYAAETVGGDDVADIKSVNMINALQGKVRMGIITNGFTSLQQTRLERTGLRDHFDLLIISEQVGVAKPDARIFDYALAQAGLERNCGAKFGNGILQYDSSAFARCKALAAAASDARMSGIALSAMSCGGSGNVGITASVPLMELARARNVSEPMLLRALALSYLLCILGKAHIGRLSPICACSLVASMGVAAGACLMLGGTQQQIDTAVSNLIGSVGGVFCDGAKYGCALKLASCVGVGLDCAMLALQNISIPAGDGVVGANADESLHLIGTLASPGMLYEDELLCRALMDREAKRR